jgi:hypothetical protein
LEEWHITHDSLLLLLAAAAAGLLCRARGASPRVDTSLGLYGDPALVCDSLALLARSFCAAFLEVLLLCSAVCFQLHLESVTAYFLPLR